MSPSGPFDYRVPGDHDNDETLNAYRWKLAARLFKKHERMLRRLNTRYKELNEEEIGLKAVRKHNAKWISVLVGLVSGLITVVFGEIIVKVLFK